MKEVADWDHKDGWDRIEKGFHTASKWMLVAAVSAVLARILFQVITGH